MNDVLPRLRAVFRPQQWEDDQCPDVGPTTEFDATEALVFCVRDAASIRHWVFHSYHTDALAHNVGLADDYEGPFEVDIDRYEWDAFWEANGVPHWRTITDEELTLVQARYACPPPETT